MRSLVVLSFVLSACVVGNPPGLEAPPPGGPDAGEPDPDLAGGSRLPTGCDYLVHTVDGAEAPQPSEAHHAGDPTPKHLHLGIAGDPRTSMVVAWRTNDNTTRVSTVQYGKAAVSEHSVDGFTWRYATGFGNGEYQRVHETHLCGLEPDTAYVYRVGGVNAEGVESWSAEHHFRTAPDLTADPSAEVVFLFLGDTRDGYDVFSRLLTKAKELAMPDLILFSGDAVTFGPIQNEWDAFLAAAEVLTPDVPWISAHGNHDQNSANYFSIFAMPGDEENYSLDYGAAHLTVANDTPLDLASITGETASFISNDLVAHAGAAWKLVMHHKPAWSASENHGSDVLLQSTWAPIFEANSVDMVLNGHDHDYERTFPMKGDQVKGTPAEGTIYVVAGGAGASLYNAGKGFWTAVSESTNHFVILRVRTGRLEYTAYREDGSILDTLIITKP
jgi:acid phosphatase type 7